MLWLWLSAPLLGCAGSEDPAVLVDDDGLEWPRLWINEFMASNKDTLEDENGESPDWLEIFNPSDVDVDLEGWTVSDNWGEPDKHTLGALEIPAGGFVLLYAGGTPEVGDAHLGFKLGAAGEELGLYSPGGQVSDELDFGAQEQDVSTARSSDGGSEWITTTEPTPGESNEG